MSSHLKLRFFAINLCSETYKEFFQNNFPNSVYNNEEDTISIDNIEYYYYPLNVENFDDLTIMAIERVK